jgi:endonuclease III
MTKVLKPRNAETRKQRVATILKRLDKDYPNAECALHHESAWQLLAATILSAQCTDVRVNMVTPGLFQKLPTVHDMANVPREALEREIQSTGFYRNKAKSLIGAQRFRPSAARSTKWRPLKLPGVAQRECRRRVVRKRSASLSIRTCSLSRRPT